MSLFAQDGTGDLLLTRVNGAKTCTILTDKVQCAAQQLTNKFLFLLGEWFLDLTQGLPFYQVIAVKNPDLRVLRQLFTKVILGTPPIVKINTLDLKLGANRRATLAIVAQADTGQLIVGGEGAAFVVQ